MSRELVIAKYKRDVTWADSFNGPITIYHKDHPYTIPFDQIKIDNGIKYLCNIGRESHTYLMHIIANYNSLADTTFFLQDDAPLHRPDIMDVINGINNVDTYIPVGGSHPRLVQPYADTRPIKSTCGLAKVFGIVLEQEYAVVPHALFGVSKKSIHRYHLATYIEILARFIWEPGQYSEEIGHHLEYFWQKLYE